MSGADLAIAASAITNGMIVVSNDVDDFRQIGCGLCASRPARPVPASVGSVLTHHRGCGGEVMGRDPS
jgi:hypothetical protein